MAWRKWRLGAGVSLLLSLFVALAGLAAGVTWQAFLAIFGAACVTHFGAFIKDHPVEGIEFEDAKRRARKLGIMLGLIGLMGLMGLMSACNTTQRRATTNTLYSLETSVTAAVDSYDTLVIQGALPTNDVPRVAKAFDVFQASFRVALDAVQFNTNAIAPPSLAVEAADVINLINTVRERK